MVNRRAALIDYGVGNIRSIIKTIESTNFNEGSIEVLVTKSVEEITSSDLIILPGVGSFGAATNMLDLYRGELVDVVLNGKPTIGICLGMQMMFLDSEEGSGQGLGLFEGSVTKLMAKKVPHMGWNKVNAVEGTLNISWGYYAHSFACRPKEKEIVKAWSQYEEDKFPAIIRKESILGTQFHPEKSDLLGVNLVHDFVSEVLA